MHVPVHAITARETGMHMLLETNTMNLVHYTIVGTIQMWESFIHTLYFSVVLCIKTHTHTHMRVHAHVYSHTV